MIEMDFRKDEAPGLRELAALDAEKVRHENAAEFFKPLGKADRILLKNALRAVTSPKAWPLWLMGAGTFAGIHATEAHAQGLHNINTGNLNLSYSQAPELNMGHVSGAELITGTNQNSAEKSLQENIVKTASVMGILPETVAVIRVDSDVAKDQHEKGRGGDARGGYVALVQDSFDGNFYWFSDLTPTGQVGVIKDVNDKDLSITPLYADSTKHRGELFTLLKDGTYKPVLSIIGGESSGYIDAGLVIQGVNGGKPIQRTVGFGHWRPSELASLGMV